jgi:hypothetical protein
MIMAAIQPQWWNSSKIITFDANNVPTVRDNPGRALNTDEYTVMEANFSLFWGLAIQAYESTLVTDNTRVDQFLAGNGSALTSLEQQGLSLFQGKAHCTKCHSGPEMTSASISSVLSTGNLDSGFLNTAVRPPAEDGGLAGTDPFGNPLSAVLLANPGAAVQVKAAFKTPGLRNVELSGPYFHNGGDATLRQVVDFYSRGGNFAGLAGANLSNKLQPLQLANGDKDALVAFLLALTDDRVRFEAAPFDHPQFFVVNGAVGDETSVVNDGFGKAVDNRIEIPATGAAGGPAISAVFGQ